MKIAELTINNKKLSEENMYFSNIISKANLDMNEDKEKLKVE